MGFTYTDKAGRTILHSWGRFRATLLEAVVVGDLLSRYSTDNAYTMQFANQSDSQAAEAIACQNGAAGDEIWCCLAAEIKAPYSVGAGGAVTQSYFAGAADFLGTALYLGLEGKPSSSAGGTMIQLVGFLLARDRILLTPGGGLLTGAGVFSTITASGAVALSSTLAVTGTLTQTGVATFAAQDVHTLGLAIAAGKTVNMVATDHAANGAIVPTGMHTISKGSAAAMTVAAGTAGDILMISSKTAHAHVITVTGQTWDGTNNTCTFTGAAGDCIVAVCISATLWAIISQSGVTLSSV